MTQRSKSGLHVSDHVADRIPYYEPPTFTATVAWVLGTVIGLSIIVLVWLTLAA